MLQYKTLITFETKALNSEESLKIESTRKNLLKSEQLPLPKSKLLRHLHSEEFMPVQEGLVKNKQNEIALINNISPLQVNQKLTSSFKDAFKQSLMSKETIT